MKRWISVLLLMVLVLTVVACPAYATGSMTDPVEIIGTESPSPEPTQPEDMDSPETPGPGESVEPTEAPTSEPVPSDSTEPVEGPDESDTREQPAEEEPSTLDDLLETTDPEIPLAGFGDGSGAAWALVNLICAILTIVFGATATITAFRTRRKKEKVGAGGKNIVIVRKGSKFKRKYRLWKIGFFNLISAVVAVVVFILTENIWTPMRWIDKWTLLMVIILAISLTVHILTASGKKLSPEEAAKLLAVGAVGDSAADA